VSRSSFMRQGLHLAPSIHLCAVRDPCAPEERQHFRRQATVGAPHAVVVIAVVFLEHVLDPKIDRPIMGWKVGAEMV